MSAGSSNPVDMVIPTTMATIPHQDSEITPEGLTPDNASEKKEQYVSDSEDEEEQEGVRQMSAITQTWDKKSLIVVYVLYVPSHRTPFLLQVL